MYILNFNTPLTPENKYEIAVLIVANDIPCDIVVTSEAIENIHIIDIPAQCDRSKPIMDEARRILASVPWLTIGGADVLFNPPDLAPLAVAIGMELVLDQHEYMMLGYLNVRPTNAVAGVATRFEVAEVYG